MKSKTRITIHTVIAVMIAGNAIAASSEKTVECNGVAADPYQIWYGIENSAQATNFLKTQTITLRHVNVVAEWLSCQGFNVVVENAIQTTETTNIYSDWGLRIDAAYRVHWYRKPALWDPRFFRFPPVYAHSIMILFDKSGNPIRVDASNTIE